MVAPSSRNTDLLLSQMIDTSSRKDHDIDSGTGSPSTITGSSFPPCTAEQCHVHEDEKKKSESKARPSCEMTEKCVNACAAYGRVCPCAARIAAHAACDAMLELQKDSQIFHSAEKCDFVHFNAEDICIGEKLGEGGFSNVNACTVTVPNHPDENQQLAIKYLKRKAMVDLHQFKHGAADLAVEAYFLKTLRHENIVSLHGITAGSVESNVALGKECGFFIVVDRLFETLEKRIDGWKKQEVEALGLTLDAASFSLSNHDRHNESSSNRRNFLGRYTVEYREQKRAELVERCEIAISLAKAMEYLHSKRIIFRDLKPDNIGFDKNNVLKLFDFGLAKELKASQQNKATGMYRLTGLTGSRRYMAPEVALEEEYDESVDIFSFGMLLWEMCAAEKPYFGYSANKHMQRVVLGNERPKMDSNHTQFWPPALQNLMKKCWSRDPSQRPNFTDIIDVLEHNVLTKVGGSSQRVLNSQNCLGLDEAVDALPSKEESDVVEEPARGFLGSLWKPRRSRSTSHDIVLEQSAVKTSPASFKHLKPTSESTNRVRSWGFGNGKK